jgi:hypothetical protein
MAPRSTAMDLDNRPSSSGGAASLAPRRTDFDKRKSRDDLYLMTSTVEKQNYKSFHVPRRGRLASLDSHYHDSSMRRPFAPARTSTADSAGSQGKGSEAVSIGMALGSPTQDTGPSMWQSPFAATSSKTSLSAHQEEESPSKSKPRKWGLFGRSKSKKGRNVDLTSPKQFSNADSPRSTVATPGGQQPSNSVARSGSLAVAPKHKPIVIRSQTDPVTPVTQSMVGKPKPSSGLPAHPARGFRKMSRDKPVVSPNPVSAVQPLLNVEIPDITMERYSIMFGQVLKQPQHQQTLNQSHVQSLRQPQPQPRIQPQQQLQPVKLPQKQVQPPPQVQTQTQSQQSSSSLLIRRQATLTKLKTTAEERSMQAEIADRVDLPRPRIGASPGHRHSPTFHLFPQPSKLSTSVQAQSPRLRSNTSPALLPSPLQAKAYRPIVRKDVPRSQTFPKPLPSNPPRDQADGSQTTIHRQLSSRFQKPIPRSQPANPIFDSPTSVDEEPAASLKGKRNIGMREPPSDVISPPASVSSRSSSFNKGPVAPEHIDVTPPEEDETERALREAVQASITRQISVSREQRQMLAPLQIPSLHGKKGQAPKAIMIGKNERLSETKTSTPTLVHPQLEPGTRSLHMHKKSEQVVVVEGVL